MTKVFRKGKKIYYTRVHSSNRIQTAHLFEVGDRVVMPRKHGLGSNRGCVIKANNYSLWVKWDDGVIQKTIPHESLVFEVNYEDKSNATE